MWVDVDGGRLYVRSSGSGSPIVMVHGWSLDHRIFGSQLQPLSRLHRVITYDRRGFGVSEAAPDLEREAEDAAAIIAALELGPVHLLGMSQGARIALRFAVSHAGLVRSLMLQGPAVDGLDVPESPAERIPLDTYAQLARAGRMNEVRRRWLAHPMMALDEGLDDARRLLREIIRTWRGADLLDYGQRERRGVDLLGQLTKFEFPCLLLTGAHETAARRAHARKLLELIPDCREVIMPASGHLSNLSEPRLYNRCVTEFCAEVDAKAGCVRNPRS